MDKINIDTSSEKKQNYEKPAFEQIEKPAKLEGCTTNGLNIEEPGQTTAVSKEESLSINTFASGFPEWTILPPQSAVRRRK